MDRLTTTTRLLENSRSTIYTSGHSTGRGTRGRPWIWITYFYSEKQWKLQCKLISPECVQYFHKSKYSILFCYQFLHNVLHCNYKWQRNSVPKQREESCTSSNWLWTFSFVVAIEDQKIERCRVYPLYAAEQTCCGFSKLLFDQEPDHSSDNTAYTSITLPLCHLREGMLVCHSVLAVCMTGFFINKPTNMRCRCDCHVTLYASCNLNSLRLYSRE